MSIENFESALEEFRQEASSVEVLRVLVNELVNELEDFDVEASSSNEHRLNMVIRGLEEDLDRIENDKLAEWDPESM